MSDIDFMKRLGLPTSVAATWSIESVIQSSLHMVFPFYCKGIPGISMSAKVLSAYSVQCCEDVLTSGLRGFPSCKW